MSIARERLVGHFETSLAAALSSLTGTECKVTVREKVADSPLEEPMVWQQSFSIVEKPALWIAAGRDLW